MKSIVTSLGLTLALAWAGAVSAQAAGISLTPMPGSQPQTVAMSSGCSLADTNAAISRPAAVMVPPVAEMLGATGSTLIAITLSSTGSLNSAKVFESSGSRLLDAAALNTARNSSYAPATHACASVGGTYGLLVDFVR